MSTPNIVVFPTPLQRDLDHQLARDFDSLRDQIGLLANYCTRLKTLIRIQILFLVILLLGIGYSVMLGFETHASGQNFEYWILPIHFFMILANVTMIIFYLQTKRTWHLENRVLSKKLELIRETGPLLAYSQQISELKWAETRIELSKYGI